MKWTEIAIPFLENNAGFLAPFLKEYEHGAWVEADLLGPFLCRVHCETPPATFEGGELLVLDDAQSRTITCWSAQRRFKPAMSVCSHQPDVEFFGARVTNGNWEIFGNARPRFLKSNSGKALKKKLELAKLKETKPYDQTGRIYGAMISV